MLSILIPTYNYSTLALVQELNNQALKLNCDYEIIVLDDASDNKEIFEENSKINLISNCKFLRNSENLGRGLNRNKLASLAKYKTLLFMDCDTFPNDNLFLNRYYNCIESAPEKVIFGGIIYQKEKPNDDGMLRWVFGNSRESISLEKRLKKPYEYALTSNLLIKKSIMEMFRFPDYITSYGFEDLVFVLKLKENRIEIGHIDNAAFHLNLEKSMVFITKFHSSLENLKYLIDTNKIKYSDSKMAILHRKLKKLKLDFIVAKIFDSRKKAILKNLTSNKPSLSLFDFYRLGYFCKLNIND